MLVLITNTAASVSTNKQPLLTQDAPAYKDVMRRWRRVSDGSTSGASVQLRVNAEKGKERRREQTALDVVVVTPHQFSSTPLPAGVARPLAESITVPKIDLSVTPRNRTARATATCADLPTVTVHWGDGSLMRGAKMGSPILHTYKKDGTYTVFAEGLTSDGLHITSNSERISIGSGSGGIILTVLLLIVLIGIAGYIIIIFRRQYLVTVCGVSFALADAKRHEVICQLVGKGYTEVTGQKNKSQSRRWRNRSRSPAL